MRRSVAVRLSPILIAATCLPASAAESVPPQEPAAVYPTSTSVVTLDFVVRDKKGRPVKNVRPEEVEVFEDSQRCEVKSFRLVDAAMAQPSGAPVSPIQRTTSLAAEPGELLNLISLVFDRLDADGGRLAQKGARDFVASLTPRDRVAVFRIGAGLQLVVPFTNDQRVLAEAIDAASRPGTEPHSLLREALQAWNNYLRMAHPDLAGPNVQMPGAAEERADAIPAGTCGAACAKELEVTANILRWADQQQRQDEATRSLYGFLALVKAQEEVAGRKTVILFSPGFSVLPAVEEALRAAIGQANRANVSFYAVDTRGLRQKSDNADTASMLQSAVTASRSQGDAEVKREQVYALDSAAESIRLGPQGNLRDLAESTGGFLTTNTNDLTAGLGRIRDDIGSYYQVTYTSPRPEADGSFRRIAIKTSRRDATVQGRSGYQALARAPTPSRETVSTKPPEAAPVNADQPAPAALESRDITRAGVASAPDEPIRRGDPALAALLGKAGAYVAGYEVAFSDLVAEEKYTQRLLSPLGSVKQTRVMRSDLLFVRLPGDIPWTTFRDVFESDGRPVRDADRRVDYGRVMEVMGLLNAAGFTHIGLVTDVPKPKPEN